LTTPKPPDQPARILVVDDEEHLRQALVRFLSRRGYQAIAAQNGTEALAVIKDQHPALVLLDIRMPGMSGIDVVPEALTIDPDLAIVMLSAVADATSAAVCMQRGALDYLTKPIELSDLDLAVTRALRRRDTLLQEREIGSWLKEEVAKRTAEVERSRRRQEEITVATLEALVNALEAKNAYLAGHSARVAAVAATIASAMKLADEEVEQVRIAGRLHDLGMIGIRESVLNKQGRLDDAEFEHVKEHVEIGSRILAPLTHLGQIVTFVHAHHEHWDGSGYPDGLRGEAIPLGARIIGASEVYDALTTSRPYQEKLDPDEAVDRMRLLTGKLIDPNVMDALSHAVGQRQTLVFLDENTTPVE
jgi:response regulator RpfG family c-di-GMP phosphodiesterase